MLLLTALLSCFALVLAAPQVMKKRDLAMSKSDRMSVAELLLYKGSKAQCWSQSNLVWPMNDMPLPSKESATKQLNIYQPPATKPRTLTVRNYCDYPIHYQHVGPRGILQESDLPAGGIFETPYVGTNWKASRQGDPSRVVQIEYNNNDGDLWYNLSLIDCLMKDSRGLPTKDASGCVGLEGGLQFGNKENMSFQCAPGTWCDDQAYFYFVCLLRLAHLLTPLTMGLGKHVQEPQSSDKV